MRGKITKRAVDALKSPRTGDLYLWDTEVPSFACRVKPSGAKSFFVQYYAPGLYQVKRRKTVGRYGPLTVEDARNEAKALLARVAKGEDVAKAESEERRKMREETVERLFADYLDYGRAHFKPRTVELYEGYGEKYIVPHLGHLPVARVTTAEIAHLHDVEWRDRPTTANNVVRLLKAFYYWLERRNLYAGRNPARGVELYRENGRERFLTVEEMARLGQAIRVAETIGLEPAPSYRKKPSAKRRRNAGMFKAEVGPANPVIVAALRFLIFTGWREQEALTLKWSDVDFSRGIATLLDTKSGKSFRALNAPALELLSAQPKVKDSPYIFPGRDPKEPLKEIQRVWLAVRYEAKLEDVRLHDLRHSVASFAGGRGYSLFLISKLLGHKDVRSSERYAHLADDIRKTMADDVGEMIRQALDGEPKAEGGEPAKLAKVIPIR